MKLYLLTNNSTSTKEKSVVSLFFTKNEEIGNSIKGEIVKVTWALDDDQNLAAFSIDTGGGIVQKGSLNSSMCVGEVTAKVAFDMQLAFQGNSFGTALSYIRSNVPLAELMLKCAKLVSDEHNLNSSKPNGFVEMIRKHVPPVRRSSVERMNSSMDQLNSSWDVPGSIQSSNLAWAW